MACLNCGLRKDQHEYQLDGGAGSGQPKYEFKHLTKRYCSGYRSPIDGYFIQEVHKNERM